MHGLIRNAVAITLGAGSLALSACTIEDAGGKKQPAASGTAATTQTAQATTPAAPSTGAQAGASGSDASVAAGMAGSTPGSAPGTATGGTSSAATTPAAANPSGGALSPDSVDVGKRSKADSLPIAKTRLEVDLAARKLYVYDGDSRVATYPVAVGSPQWPTQTGQWFVRQVIWNPEWIPPDETWAEQRVPKKPGAPDNPLGRAQLVYDPPRTIHGTNEPASIGKPVSHGSIRLANAVIVQLARQLMDATGAGKDDAWYARVQKNRTEKVVVDLPQRVPIRVF
jgi:lipoprotein-anchoring transpeptidase ErfK/SrfK